MATKKKVIVTGFEPFGEHTVNASWVAVQELERLGLGEAIDLHVCEVPVEYEAVQSLLPSLWKQHQPQLVVHVGVSGLATTVTLEQCGHNQGYQQMDNCGFNPASQCCMENGPNYLDSVLDMDVICRKVNDSGLGVVVSVSKDAGRYLCDYTYYTSLYLTQGRSAFIHVPPLGKPYSSQDLARALQTIVLEMSELLNQAEEQQNPHDH
ncbi:pyroglutamyl-peptidase 1-like [Lampris incognitus]|uniref:pyroglutamyl-peptidase 1-like n=1 Tax=Lampris incognitus TaxID=2546036 RepID=UPI0024B4AA64|nr:pyroglutamyl-peptidase 1-like [Lampris incognitus]